jgi:hypothetical protein
VRIDDKISFSEEGILAVHQIVKSLASLNHDESGTAPIELAVNIPAYDNAAARVYTMRDMDELVGYAVFFVIEHPHYQGTMFAMNDVVYIYPSYRAKYAKDFIDYVSVMLEQEVKVITFSMNYEKPHMNLMKSLGYSPVEVVYHKVVQNG